MQVVVSRVVLPGGAVYSVFIWLVVPVLVTSTCTKTAAMCLFWCQLGYFLFGITYCFLLYLGGCHISLFWRVLKWCHLWGFSGCTAVVVYLCDGKLDVPVFAVTTWEMLYYFYFVLFWLYSLSDGWWFLCVAGLRGHWGLANLFLLHRWVPTLILWGLVWVTWFYCGWGHFEIDACTCDLTFTFSYCWILLFALNICDGGYDLDLWQSWKLVIVVT